MKTTVHGSMAGLMRIFLLMSATLLTGASTPVTADDDLNQIFEQGRTAFYRGDYETAQRLLTLVQAGDPRHGPTRGLLAQIKLAAPPDGEFLKKNYSAIVLQKVEMEEVTLQDCLQGLIIISKNATEGKLAPNLILQAKDKADTKVTMNLSNIPLPEAIDYVARLSGTKVKWEKHAVVFLGVAD
jgi:hypothetical protein